MDQDQDGDRDTNRDMNVDPLPLTLAQSQSRSRPLSSSPSLDLPKLDGPDSSSNHPHSHHHDENEKDTTHNHLHRAHLQLHQIGSFNDQNGDDQNVQNHLQLHKTGHHSHHSHQRLYRSNSPANPRLHAAQPDKVQPDALKPRAEQNLVTQVVQTVSLIQVVDPAGSPIELQTHYAPPATVVVDSASGSTVAISNPDPAVSVAVAASILGPSYNVPPPSSVVAATAAVQTDTPGLTDPSPSLPAPDTTASVSAAEPFYPTLSPTTDVPSDTAPETLLETSAPITTADPDTTSQDTTSTAAPTSAIDTTSSDVGDSETDVVTTDDLSATTTEAPILIETTSDITSEAISDVTSEATSDDTSEVTAQAATDVTQSEPVISVTTSTPPTTSNTSSRTRSSSIVIVVSSTFVTSSINHSPTLSDFSYSDTVYSSVSAQETWTSSWADDDYEGEGSGTGEVQPPAATNTSNSNEADTGTLSTQQKQVIGGVVGSVAGVAFLAFFILLALRYKKKHPGGGLLGGNQTGTRAIGGPDSGSGGAMAERSMASAAITSAFAGLIGKKGQQQSTEAAPTGERGFYRVSGKKLPSVLQVGGDGYSDPRIGSQSNSRMNRESVMSGHSDYWRGSMAFDPNDRESPHLALGSPMRPISGVPVIRSGPARTPVTESNPFSDPPRPRPDSDALGGSIGGGSIASGDGSNRSPSRFQERI
ncbi:hypothetical protein F66182_6810 [Fusarium sp. NRRL 66182]|nr:hypothetical protein F66182_6810 [Fusarium sp. NRRL 66182]